jgi:cell division protein FtsB
VALPFSDDTPVTEIRPVLATARSWRPRLTGRAAVLVMVLAVLTVSYASSLKAYLQQRQHIAELKAQITQSEADIDALEREKARWRDPAYVQSQARARFGYVMPGETSYVVLDADGKPLEAETSLMPKQAVLGKEPVPWFSAAWDSVLLAGNPPAPVEKPTPLEHIDAPKE